jgi:hypothetical protein
MSGSGGSLNQQATIGSLLFDAMHAHMGGPVGKVFSDYVRSHRTDKWMLFSDYVFGDRNRPNDVIALTVQFCAKLKLGWQDPKLGVNAVSQDGDFWSDPFLRVPDHFAGFLAAWDLANDAIPATPLKYRQVLEDGIASRPNVHVMRLFSAPSRFDSRRGPESRYHSQRAASVALA